MEINEQLKKELKLLILNFYSSFPLIKIELQHYNNYFQFYNKFINEIQDFIKPKKQQIDDKQMLKLTKSYIQDYKDFIERFETKMKLQESNIKYIFPTFSFVNEKVLKYGNKLDLVKRYDYYLYLLKEYPNYLVRRFNLLQEEIYKMLNSKNSLIDNRLYLIIENVIKNEPDLTKITSLPEIPETFEERIMKELTYIEKSINIKQKVKSMELSESFIKTQLSEKLSTLLNSVFNQFNTNEELLPQDINLPKDETIEENNQTEKKIENDINRQKLIPNKKVIEIFNVHRNTLANWRKKNLISYIRINRQIYYDKEEIKSFIDKRKSNLG